MKEPKCECKKKISAGSRRHKWIRCKNKPEFVFISKPRTNRCISYGFQKKLCKEHMKKYIQAWKLNNFSYETHKLNQKCIINATNLNIKESK